MPSAHGKLVERELREKARAYVQNDMRIAGGFPQAWRGFWLKTFPFVFGVESRPSLLRIFALLIRTALLVGAAMAPMLARRVAEFRSPGPDQAEVFLAAITHVDKLDIALAGLVVTLNFGVR